MTELVVLALDKATPQGRAPGEGDTYLLPRSMHVADGAQFVSKAADGASAVAFDFDTALALSTSGAKIALFQNQGVEKGHIDKDGGASFSGGNFTVGSDGALVSPAGASVSLNGGVGSGIRSVAIGKQSEASGIASQAFGNACLASGVASTAMGADCKADKRSQGARTGKMFATQGDAQISDLVASNQTADATQTEIFLDGTAASARCTIESDTTWMFRISVVARRTDADGESAAYTIEGCIDNNAGTVALVGSINKAIIAEDNAAWDVTAEADDTNDALVIKVTGEASKTIQWVARISLVETTG